MTRTEQSTAADSVFARWETREQWSSPKPDPAVIDDLVILKVDLHATRNERDELRIPDDVRAVIVAALEIAIKVSAWVGMSADAVRAQAAIEEARSAIAWIERHR